MAVGGNRFPVERWATVVVVVVVMLLAALALDPVFEQDETAVFACCLVLMIGPVVIVSSRLVRFVGRWVRRAAAHVRVNARTAVRQYPFPHNRLPLVGGWVRRRVIRALAQNGSPQAVTTLAEIVVNGSGRRAREMALDELGQFTDRGAVYAVCQVWEATRHADLFPLLSRPECLASAPPEIRVLIALKLGCTDVVTEGGASVIAPLLRACNDVDPVIAERARQAVWGLETDEGLEALCRLGIKQGDPVAWEVVLASGYLPRDERQRALFFFLTEQWEEYDLLDFDRQLLRMAYTGAGRDVQRRIREKMRKAARADFLSIIAGEDYVSRVPGMSAGEIDLLVQTLIANRRWETLWDLVTEVSYTQSVQIVDTLLQNEWRPEREDERAALAELAVFVKGGLPVGEEEVRDLFPLALPEQAGAAKQYLVPPALLRARARVPGRINDIAFLPARPVIAVGTGRRKVVLWNYQRAERERVLGGFDHSIGSVACAGDGTLLCAERTNRRDVPCAIYGWDGGGNQFCLGRHSGSVTALEPVGESQALSAGRDGRIVLWDVPARQIVAEKSSGWVRTMCVSPDARQAMLRWRRGIYPIALPSLAHRYNAFRGPGDAARCFAYTPDGETLLVGRADGDVATYRFRRQAGRFLAFTWLGQVGPALTHHDGGVVAVSILPGCSVVVSAGQRGSIHFAALWAQGAGGAVQAPPGQVTSLHVSPDERVMAVGSSDALLTLWALGTLGVQGLFLHPLAWATASVLPTLDALAADEDLAEQARRAAGFVACALRHRFRFDVELGEMSIIKPGEFDIEVD